MRRRVFFLIITIVWIIVIFSFSAKPAEESDDMSLSVGYTIGQIFVLGFEEWPAVEQEDFAEKINYPVRKCAHATEYAVLGVFLAGAVLGGRRDRRLQVLWCFAIGVAYAASDELHQVFVPGRAGRVTDVLIDSAGLIVGVLVMWGVSRWRKKRGKYDKK